jgi:ABC-2 type transport system permease protein
MKKELNHAFNSWTLYIGLLLFFCVCGFYCWMSGDNVFYIGRASMMPIFTAIKWIFLFFVPTLTMRIFSDERRHGTLELLLTKPLKSNQLIFGKYYALLLITILMLALTLPYYITIASLGDVDNGQVIMGYLGLILVNSAYISIGTFASAVSRSNISAFMISIGIILCFQFLFSALGEVTTHTVLSELLTYLSIDEHFESLSRGMLDTRDVVYFLSIDLLFLALTRISLCRIRV